MCVLCSLTGFVVCGVWAMYFQLHFQLTYSLDKFAVDATTRSIDSIYSTSTDDIYLVVCICWCCCYDCSPRLPPFYFSFSSSIWPKLSMVVICVWLPINPMCLRTTNIRFITSIHETNIPHCDISHRAVLAVDSFLYSLLAMNWKESGKNPFFNFPSTRYVLVCHIRDTSDCEHRMQNAFHAWMLQIVYVVCP